MTTLMAATLMLVTGAPLTWAAGAITECGQCQVKAEAKSRLVTARTDYGALLQKNKDYLAKLGPDESSKLIKLSSNITLLNIKLDGIDQNIAEIDQELAKNCASCPGPKPSPVTK